MIKDAWIGLRRLKETTQLSTDADPSEKILPENPENSDE